MRIKSITGSIHDTSFGGYPYKITVMVEIPVKDFNKICPIVRRDRSYFGSSKSVRDLGNLVLDVNNAVYRLNSEIPSYNPSIDSNGSRRAFKGLKTLEFVYFFKDHSRAEKLGFEVFRNKIDDAWPKYGQYIKIFEDKS
jgi:hypothetical protein